MTNSPTTFRAAPDALALACRLSGTPAHRTLVCRLMTDPSRIAPTLLAAAVAEAQELIADDDAEADHAAGQAARTARYL